jgi:chromosome segregation ATPase
MQHISRIYIGNYGHRMCWYDGLTLSFLDHESGQPCDHIIHLENGGGKSTLLAGIFSCFEPRQDRFLKTLHDQRNKFSDYFREDGTPGFIVVEWQNRHEPSSAPKRVITGQAVAIKNVLSHELERVFFHFESNEDLSLETLPLPKLSDTAAETMHDFSAWLHRMQTKHRGNLYSTRNQQEWEKSLEAERGIDLGLLKQQLEFSRQEGAVDAFLNFKTESEFLHKLLGLTMDQDRAMSVRDNIALACDKLRDKPKYERRLGVLRDCEAVLNTFATAAEAYVQVRNKYAEAQQAATLLAFSLEARIAARNQNQQELDSERNTSSASLQEQRQQKLKLSSDLNGLLFEDLRQSMTRAKDAHDSAQESLKQKEHEIHLLEAARSYSEVIACEQRLRELNQLDAKAREQLAPFAEEAEKAGSILKALLQEAITTLQESENKLQEEVKTGREQLASVELELRRLLEDRTRLEKELSKLEALEERCQSEREHLFKSTILVSPDEEVSVAQSRLDSARQSASLAIEQEERALLELAKLESELQKQVTQLNYRQAHDESQLNGVQEELTAGESLYAELSQDATLRSVVDNIDVVDPELPDLTVRLENFNLQLRQKADQHAVSLARLNSFQSEFETTALAGGNPDVGKVIRCLAESGVRSAIAYTQYLANVLPDAEQARHLISQNPARFLGIALQDEDEIDLARRMLPPTFDISQPIVISASSQTAAEDTKILVVNPASDAAFNFEAARAFAQDLATSIFKETAEYETCNTTLALVADARHRLNQFLERFGHGTLAKLNEESQSLRNDIDARAAEIKQLLLDNEAMASKEATLRASVQELSEQLHRLTINEHALKQFAERVEAPLLASRHQLSQGREAIAHLQEKTESGEKQKRLLSEMCEDKRLLAQKLSHEADILKREINEVMHSNDQFDAVSYLAENAISLVAARNFYRDQSKLLQTEEQQRLGLLGSQIDNCRQNLARAKDTYDRDYSKMELSKVISIIDSIVNIDEALNQGKNDLSLLVRDSLGLRDSWTLSEAKLKEFKKALPEAEQKAKEFKAYDHNQLRDEIASVKTLLQDCDALINHLAEHINVLDKQLLELSHEIDLLNRSLLQLVQALEDYLAPGTSIEMDHSHLPLQAAKIDELVAQSTKEIKEITKVKDTALRAVEKQFRDMQVFTVRPEVMEAEPTLSSYLTQNSLNDSIANAQELKNAISQRIAAVESMLASLNKDFEESLEELVNLVGEGIHVLTASCSKRLPDNAPYIGGKPVLRMRSAFPPGLAETRRQVLSGYMNSIIESGFPHKTGTALVADAILQVAAGSLGLQIVKLIRDPTEQYVAINKLSNSGGEAVSMAMFLYLLIARVRADMQANARRQVGGPLILDNPFAKATSSFIWRAQRDLASSLGVQLILATALPDYNALGEFDHFIRLRKCAQNKKTGRWHIEQTEFSFVN